MKGEDMTNYEKLFESQMQDPQFVKAYYQARVERVLDEMLESLKGRIAQNESKEDLIQAIDSLQQQIRPGISQELHTT
jgi:hypothetical protein